MIHLKAFCLMIAVILLLDFILLLLYGAVCMLIGLISKFETEGGGRS